MERESQRLDRQLALERLAASVPYKEAIDAIEIDPERTKQATIASALEKQKQLQLFKAGGDGYTIETLFKDVRFKIGLALRDAGVSGSDHARNILSTLKPSRPQDVHMVSRRNPFSSIQTIAMGKY